jgi:hypothetical protein
MIFLFVGSSGLTEASYPRNLAIPQLLLSSACAKLLTMKASRLAVFLHRGLSPRQFTPMSGAHKIGGANRRPASPFYAGRQFGRASCAPPFLSAAVAHLWRSATKALVPRPI